MPIEQQSRLERLGGMLGGAMSQAAPMLGGLGAGLAGNLPQYQLAQQQMAESQQVMQQREQAKRALEQQAAAEAERNRQVMMAQTAQAALELAEAGDYASLAQMGMDQLRMASAQGLPLDDLQRLEMLARAASNGSDEAAELLKGELTTEVAIAKSLRLIETPEDEIIPESSINAAGQVVVRRADGSFGVEMPEGYTLPATQEPATIQALRIRASEAGLQPGTPEFAEFMRTGGGGGVNVTTNVQQPGVDAATQEFGRSIGTRAAARLETAASAVGQNETLMRMAQSIGDGARTGIGQETLLNIQNLGQSMFGLPISENASEQEVLRALSNRLVMEVRNPTSGMGLPGSTSNRDLDFLTASVPGLAKTPQGNALLIEYLMKQNQFKQDIANEQQRIIDENNGVVPSNLDTRLMRYANQYQFADDEFKREVEEALKISEIPVNRFQIEVLP